MFEGIKSFIRETRIRFDYSRFESKQTMAHQAEAERRFDIGQLQREVAQIKVQAGLAGDQPAVGWAKRSVPTRISLVGWCPLQPATCRFLSFQLRGKK